MYRRISIHLFFPIPLTSTKKTIEKILASLSDLAHRQVLSLDVVTVTIGAMTIDVGVDYSIHITQRYREERANGRNPVEAVENTLPATGMALLGAAASTALGFGVLAFASMKMFAAFGIMTAFMVVYSFAASVIVLPVLLLLVDRRDCACGPAGET